MNRRSFLAGLCALALPVRPSLAFPDGTPGGGDPPANAGDPVEGIGVSFGDALASLIGVDRQALAQGLTTALGLALVGAALPDDVAGRIQVVVGAPPPGWRRVELRKVPLVPVVSPRLQVSQLPSERLGDLLGGKPVDWKSLGAYTSAPVVLFGLGPLLELADPRQVIRANRTFADVDGLAAAMLGRIDGLAFLPLPSLTPLLKPLPIGAMDAASGHASPDAYPLSVVLSIAVAPDAPDWVVTAVRSFAEGFQAAPQAPSYNVLFLGDVIQGRDVHLRMVAARDFQLPFRKVAPFTTAADLTIADNECDYSDTLANPVYADPHTFSFVTKTAAADGLRLAGVHGVSLANNHSMNMGRQGIVDTLAALDARGILHTGAGMTLAEGRRPAVFTVKGVRIALLGYNGISAQVDGATDHSAGTVPMDMAILREDMALATAQADVVIPYFHWSVEYTSDPTDQQVRFAHAAIDLGAAAVIGSHPHWVQATEIYKGKHIVYSLGNFVFDQEWSLETKRGAMAELLMLGSRVVGVRLIPVLITNYSTPHVASPAEAAPIFDHIWQATDALAARQAARGTQTAAR